MPRAVRNVLVWAVALLAAGAARHVHLGVDHGGPVVGPVAALGHSAADGTGADPASGACGAGEADFDSESGSGPDRRRAPERDEHDGSCDLCRWLGGMRADALHLGQLSVCLPLERARPVGEAPVARVSSAWRTAAQPRGPPVS